MLSEEGVDRRVRPRDGTGMRGGELLRRRGASKLVDNDRLSLLVGAPGHCREGVGRADGLEEQDDRLGLGIVDKHLADLGNREIALVADRDDLGEAEAARLAARDEGAGEAAAVRHHADVALLQLRQLENEVRRDGRGRIHVVDAHAVGADQPDAALLRRVDDFLLQAGALRP